MIESNEPRFMIERDLMQDKRNFLVDPPENTTYKFDMAVYSPVATATLKEDPNLANMRFELVPKM
jgi:hypothetical protein